MSELIARSDRHTIRWQLLSTASALVILASTYSIDSAAASNDDTDRPTVWIELGGRLVHMDGQGDAFTPAFLTTYANSPVLQPTTPLRAQRPIPFSFSEEGKISLQPRGSDWVFSAAVHYGRSNNVRHVDHQTNRTFHSSFNGVPSSNPLTVEEFADTQAHHQESHTVLDFSAGKDVGLGMFGRDGSSVFSLGVRFAQFSSKATFDVRARPDLHYKYFTFGTHKGVLPYFHTYHATGNASRSFHGLGPSLAWNGSTAFVGNPRDGEVTFDWGANAALLFGKQKTHVRHQETAHYVSIVGNFSPAYRYQLLYQHSGGHDAIRSVTIPNVGGFAGASYRIENFKVSAGYRADFFFGAIDGGIDARKSEALGFYGPFASISVGLP